MAGLGTAVAAGVWALALGRSPDNAFIILSTLGLTPIIALFIAILILISGWVALAFVVARVQERAVATIEAVTQGRVRPNSPHLSDLVRFVGPVLAQRPLPVVAVVIVLAALAGVGVGWTAATVPIEDITVDAGDEVTVTRGFVLEDSGTWMTVLEMGSRDVVYLPSGDITARVWVDQ